MHLTGSVAISENTSVTPPQFFDSLASMRTDGGQVSVATTVIQGQSTAPSSVNPQPPTFFAGTPSEAFGTRTHQSHPSSQCQSTDHARPPYISSPLCQQQGFLQATPPDLLPPSSQQPGFANARQPDPSDSILDRPSPILTRTVQGPSITKKILEKKIEDQLPAIWYFLSFPEGPLLNAEQVCPVRNVLRTLRVHPGVASWSSSDVLTTFHQDYGQKLKGHIDLLMDSTMNLRKRFMKPEKLNEDEIWRSFVFFTALERSDSVFGYLLDPGKTPLRCVSNRSIELLLHGPAIIKQKDTKRSDGDFEVFTKFRKGFFNHLCGLLKGQLHRSVMSMQIDTKNILGSFVQKLRKRAHLPKSLTVGTETRAYQQVQIPRSEEMEARALPGGVSKILFQRKGQVRHDASDTKDFFFSQEVLTSEEPPRGKEPLVLHDQHQEVHNLNRTKSCNTDDRHVVGV